MHFGGDVMGLKTCFVGLKKSFDGLGINDANPKELFERLLEQFDRGPGLFSGVTRLKNGGEADTGFIPFGIDTSV